MATFNTQALIEGYEKAIKLAKDFLDLSKDTNLQIKQTAENIETFSKGLNTATAKGLKDANAEMEKANELTELKIKNDKEAQKTEQELIKTEKLLSQARILETKEKEELHKLEQVRNKTLIQVSKERERQLTILKKEVKLNKKELDAYQKKSKELNENRKAYKALAAAQQGTTSEGKKLLKNITALDKELKEIDDTVGQNTRTVGKYKDAVKGLNSTLGKLGIAAVIAKGVQLLGSAFGDSREGALSMQIQIAKVTETVKVFVNSVINAMPGVIEIFSSFKDTFKDIGIQSEILGLKIEKALTITSSGKRTVQAEIEALEATLSKSSFSSGLAKIKAAFEGNIETTSKAIDAQEKYLRLQLATKISISEQEKALAGLQEKRQILQDMSDDDTIGFVTRARLVKQAEEIAIEFEKKQVALAKTKEKLTFEAVKQDLRRAKVSVDNIRTSEQLIRLIKKGDNAKKISDANDEAFTAAYSERREAEIESESFKRDQEEKFRKTARDAFEQELDILEEFTEKKVAANEKIINDDKASLEQRQAAADENVRLTEKLFLNSIELIIAQGKASIDLRADLSEAEKQTQKDMLTNISLQEILNTQDATEIFALLRKLDLGELEEKRSKETLKIKKDLVEVNKESAKVEEEAVQKTKELNEDIILQERKLAGEKIDLEKERFENEKKNLQERIDLLVEDSVARLELEKELNELLLEEQKESIKNNQELRDAGLEASTEIAISLIDSISEAKTNAAQRELDDAIRNQDIILQGIENGSKLGEASLALEKKVQAEREAELKRLERKALQLKALIALLEVWGQTGDIGETLQGFATIKAAASTVDGAFYEGTDSVGSDGSHTKVHNGKDGYRAALNGKERVFNNSETAELDSLGFTTRDSMLDLARMSDMGVDKGGNLVTMVNDNSAVVERLDKQNELLKALPKLMPIHNTGLNDDPRYINQVIKRGNSRTTTKRKANTGWGL